MNLVHPSPSPYNEQDVLRERVSSHLCLLILLTWFYFISFFRDNSGESMVCVLHPASRMSVNLQRRLGPIPFSRCYSPEC